jgi:hypothetical protein
MKDKFPRTFSSLIRPQLPKWRPAQISRMTLPSRSIPPSREHTLKRDKDPMFVTLAVACEGRSVNGRNYRAENLESIVEQISSDHPDGYAGHLTD